MKNYKISQKMQKKLIIIILKYLNNRTLTDHIMKGSSLITKDMVMEN